MKKTLVALAVLAASGASFAQVTMSGDMEWGWAGSHNGTTKSDASGLGVDTAELYFDTVEDLGGGMKISGHMGLIGLSRNGESAGSDTVHGENFALALTGGFGKLDLQTTRNSDYLCVMSGEAAAPCFDGNVWGARSYRDQFVYTTPDLVPGLKASLYWGEPNFQTAAANDAGMGAGETGTSLQRKTILSLAYASGNLAANVGYVSQDNRVGSATSASGTTGAFVVGAAADSESYDNGTTLDTIINVNVPVGAFSFGIDAASRKYSGFTDGVAAHADGTQNGFGIGARYALSKSTAVWWQYKSYDAIVAAGEKSTYNEIAIAKSF